MLNRIVITGAPASGKTLFFERLKNSRLCDGFIFFDELARKLLLENQDYRNNWDKFHIDIYNRQVERENRHSTNSFITDRGTVDTFAFHPQTAQNVDSTIDKEYARYTAVILLESSANLGDRYYKTDKIRNESIKEALEIENNLHKAWSSHPNFHRLTAENSIENKFASFYQLFEGIIG